MELRSGTQRDLLRIGRVAQSGYWEGWRGLLQPETIDRMLRTAFSPGAVARRLLRGSMVVAESGGGIIGFLDAAPEGGVLHVSAIATERSMRRRGVGRALLGEAERRHGSLPLRVDVLLGNEVAEGFLEHLGFVPGEAVSGNWFDEDVVERCWWREPGALRAWR
jgi:GNAT superfamily N-acetyltransferase